ncbi:hypothetical protein CUREO_1621 [Campylobacter ureolyticus RIGS 9880]|uniref:Uncharacterized protein n=2 Tax=Campylobacter ureolyticus TaxID=827 RepID=S3XG67_9BACT|nr:hypothetical protein [Campylobacter ureolyticus]AKT91427.1 hypothetical protein CUREO_1621 [Campylobacter ureolyticus RIGS 9880]EPH09864.1 hypothetical protein HMPREF9309_00501 [Campylobacter ureolyticus ACS-301-V-Sch3b]MCZ6156593.1 hypothetical protein [Campylobacter ureolyticus]MCZ6173177.1 hypothetical protein [Campylobacter ureolyticus]MDU7070989.1 hypothetical protein [Campylobacter ureolyticus]
MEYENIKNQIKAEIENKKANDKLLVKISNQIKITEKAQANVDKEKEKLEKLMEEKQNLANQIQANFTKENGNE